MGLQPTHDHLTPPTASQLPMSTLRIALILVIHPLQFYRELPFAFSSAPSQLYRRHAAHLLLSRWCLLTPSTFTTANGHPSSTPIPMGPPSHSHPPSLRGWVTLSQQPTLCSAPPDDILLLVPPGPPCRFSTSLFRRFRNPKDKRDFVTAGVSVGVATAFNAPIGESLCRLCDLRLFPARRCRLSLRLPWRCPAGCYGLLVVLQVVARGAG